MYYTGGDLLGPGRGDAGHGALWPGRRLDGAPLLAGAAEEPAGPTAGGLRRGAAYTIALE